MDQDQRGLFDQEFLIDLELKRSASRRQPDVSASPRTSSRVHVTPVATGDHLRSLGFSPDTPSHVSVELNAACSAVLAVLRDGQWHGAAEIISRSGYTEAMRRLRELRDYGYAIEKRGNGRSYEYRLTQ